VQPTGDNEMRWKYALAVAVLPLCQSAVQAATQPTPELQALDDALPGDLINDPTRIDWNVYGAGMKRKTIKNATIPGGGAALQITSPNQGRQPYEITAEVPVNEAIADGEKLTVAFYARTAKADTTDGQGLLAVRIQQKVSPWTGFGDQRMNVGTEWKLYQLKFVSNRMITNGEAIVAFQIAGAKQLIEIGQTYVLRMSPNAAPQS
jgi:hypothetical protein